MLTRIVRFSLQYRGAVLALAALALLYGGYTLTRAQYDIFPEFVPPQVTIQTEAPGLSPQQVEMLVTQPVESAVGGLPELESMRSSSIQGLSVVRITFRPASDIFRDRQAISERLETLTDALPHGMRAVMTPLTSSTSIVYSFGLTSDTLSLMDLRAQADWVVKPRLLAIPGVNRVIVFGGDVKQMQVQLLPEKLKFYNLGINDVIPVVQRATGVAGAGFIDTPNQRIMLQTYGQATTPQQLANTVFLRGQDEAGEAIDLNIVLGDVATITEAPEPATGLATIMGRNGIVISVSSAYGANTLEVTRHVEAALAELIPALQKQGVNVSDATFRPANFIETAIENLTASLLVGAVLVIVVLFLFLRHARSALITATAIPLSLLTAAACLHHFGYSLNTMTLGGLAIAIGSVVDDAVIDVENILRRLRENRQSSQRRPRLRVILDASVEVRVPVVFASLAVILVFLPVIAMTGLSGRLFAPLGIAHSIAILMSLLVALTVTPALCMLFLREETTAEPRFVQRLKSLYTRALEPIAGKSSMLLAAVAVLTVASLCTLPLLHERFIPELREGHFIVHMAAIPGTSLQESIRVGNQLSQALMKLPSVRSVTQQAGRAEQGDETAGTHASEFDVALKPLSGEDMEHAEADIYKALADFPGLHFAVNTFLAERMEETLSGYTSGVVVNVYDSDLNALDTSAKAVADALKAMPDAANVQLQSPPGTPQLSIRLRDKDLHYWGFDAADVLNAIHIAYEGETAAHLYEGNRTTDVSVILEPHTLHDITQVRDLPFRSPAGSYIRLEQLADIAQDSGRYTIQHDGARRVQAITLDVKGGRETFIAKARKAIAEKVALPSGSYIAFAGTAEAEEQARSDLIFHGAMVLLAIAALLSVIMRHRNNLLLVLLNVPFALTGGIIAVLVSGGSLSLGAMVGFVTLFGISLRNSVMLMAHYAHLVREEGAEWNLAAMLRGSSERLLPIVMTALPTALGLLPLAVGSENPGQEIEGPMVLVILCGLITSTLLNLLVLPALALRFGEFDKDSSETDL